MEYFKFPKEFEAKALACWIKQPEIMTRFNPLMLMGLDHFRIGRVVADYRKESNGLTPEWPHIKTILGRNHDDVPEEDMEGLLDAVDEISSLTCGDAEMVAVEVAKFMSKRAVCFAIQKYLDSEERDSYKLIEGLWEASAKADEGSTLDAASLLTSPLTLPEEVIKGLLHKSMKTVIGGDSKSYKTWTLLDMAVSVSTGTPFWDLHTVKGKVLYLNLEIDTAFFGQRLKEVCKAKRCTPEAGMLTIMCLRGRSCKLEELVVKVLSQLRGSDYSLVIIDPVYKLLDGRDENRASDIASLLNEFEVICTKTGAEVVFASHFSKGNQAAKVSHDRISGSGVFARDPDTIITLTRHEQENAFVVETTLRNLPRLAPFCLEWDFPLFVRNEELDPKKLKKTGGREEQYSGDELLSLLKEEPLATNQWATLAKTELGISPSTFHRKKKDLELAGRILNRGKKWGLCEKHSHTPDTAN